MITVKYSPLRSRLLGDIPNEVENALEKHLSFEASGAFFSPAAASGEWDGVRHFYSTVTRGFKSGLVSKVIRFLEAQGQELSFVGFPVLERRAQHGEYSLRPHQEEGVRVMFERTRGIVQSPPRSGKTMIACAFLDQSRLFPAVFMCNSIDIASQTRKVFEKFIPGAHIGLVGDGEFDIGDITIITVQSAVSAYEVEYKNRRKAKRQEQGKAYKKIGSTNDITNAQRATLQQHFDTVKTVIYDECLPSNASIETEVGVKPIKWVVDTKFCGKVKSLDNDGNIVWKPVIGWFNKSLLKPWMSLCGKRKTVRLRCTEDHECYYIQDPLRPQFDKVPAKDMVGRYAVVNFMKSREGHPNNYFNAEQVQILLGAFLGDGYIEGGGRARITHGEAQFEYLLWLQDLLSGGVIREVSSGYCDNKVFQLCLPITDQTRFLSALGYVTSGDRRIKVVSRELAAYIEAPALAIWYMDDGSVQHVNGKSYITFHTQGFDRDSVVNLQSTLIRFGIESKIRSVNVRGVTRLTIALDGLNSQKFLDIVLPFRCLAMGYKFKVSHDKIVGELHTWNKVRRSFSSMLVHSVEPWITTSMYGRYYDITVEDTHRFFANGYLVSNCHHAKASTAAMVFRKLRNAQAIFGLSATPNYGLPEDMLIEAEIGEIIYGVSYSFLIEQGWLLPPKIYIYKLPRVKYSSSSYQTIYKEAITQNVFRNTLIARIAEKIALQGMTVLIVVDKKTHGNEIAKYIRRTMAYTLYGEAPLEERNAVKAALNAKRISCVISTLWDEGVDIAGLNFVINAAGGMSPVDTFQRLRSITPNPDDPRKTYGGLIDFGHKEPYLMSHSLFRARQYRSEPLFEIHEHSVNSWTLADVQKSFE